MSFDSNVLVYTLDVDDRRHERAAELILRASKADCVLALQSLGELYHVVTRKRLASVEVVAGHVEDLLATFPTVAYDTAALRLAVATNRRHGLPFWDAMLVATVRGAGCDVLLTEDLQDGRDLEGLRILDPFAAGNERLVDLVLPRLEVAR